MCWNHEVGEPIKQPACMQHAGAADSCICGAASQAGTICAPVKQRAAAGGIVCTPQLEDLVHLYQVRLMGGGVDSSAVVAAAAAAALVCSERESSLAGEGVTDCWATLELGSPVLSLLDVGQSPCMLDASLLPACIH